MKTIKQWFGKWLILTILWFVLNLIDFSNLQLANTNSEALLGYAIMAMLDSLILCWILAKSTKCKFSLVAPLFMAIFGMKILLTAVEAAYLPDLQPMFIPLLINGAIASIVWSATAVLICISYSSKSDQKQIFDKPDWSQKWYQWIYKPVLVAIIWMVLFVVFGGLVFMNIAKLIDPQALASYSNLNMPDWVLPFQGLRAILWLALSLPLLSQLSGTRSSVMLLTGAIFGVWMGSNLLLALDFSPGLRYAHLAEVMLECFVFGIVIVLIFTRKHKQTLQNE